MARRKNSEDGGQHEEGQDVTRLANSGARAELIRSAARYIIDREEEIAAVRADINEYKQKHIKGDLGFKLSNFATILRVYKLEREDRDELLDALREGFAALGIGGQLDWVAAAERQPANDAA